MLPNLILSAFRLLILPAIVKDCQSAVLEVYFIRAAAFTGRTETRKVIILCPFGSAMTNSFSHGVELNH
jgi:hypothetical protein